MQTKVEIFSISNCENVLINENIININLFSLTSQFYIFGKIRSIQSDLFSKLPSVKYIALDIYFAKNLFQSTKIEWIKKLNENLKIHRNDFENFTNHIKFVNIVQRFYPEYYFQMDVSNIFPDEDFCLYKDFPFSKLILLSIQNNAPDNIGIKLSCTFLWIAQDYNLYLKHFDKIKNGILFYNVFKNFSSDQLKCNFSKALENCNLKSIFKNDFDLNDLKNLFTMLDYIIIIYSIPFFSIICFLLNSFILMLLFANKKSKELKKTFYKFLSIYSSLSLFYVTIQLLNLMNECLYKNGLFCSSIVSNQVVQLFKIIITDYVMHIIKSAINLSLVGYSTLRLNILIGSSSVTHKFFTGSSIKKICFISFSILAVICVPKLFIHQINNDDPDLEYPSFLLDLYSSFVLKSREETVLIALNLLSDLFTVFGIILINFLVDILLAIKLKSYISKSVFKKTNKSKRQYTKLVGLAFVMIFINLILKSTEIFQTLYILLSYTEIFHVYKMRNNFQFFLREICLRLSFPSLINHFLDLAFLISNILNIFVYFYNDKNIKKISKNYFHI